ncbi:MAG TPA: hypothetical protein VFP72_08175, partial [Kineosporiaceae bacterium]|nr:hypothetical protein [Kineosporiaceae bacterium]
DVLTLYSWRGDAELISLNSDMTRRLSSQGMFAEARLWLDLVNRTTTRALKDGNRLPQEDPLAAMGLVDSLGLAHVNSILGLLDYVRALSSGFPDWVEAEIKRPHRPLGQVPRTLMSNLKDAIAFEISIEGRQITPGFVCAQLAGRALATEVVDELALLIGGLESDYLAWVDSMALTSNYDLVGTATSRLDEAIEKLDAHRGVIEQFLAACEEVHRDVDDTWPETALSATWARVRLIESSIVKRVAEVAEKAELLHTPTRPDTFGWSYERLVDGILDSIIHSDSDVLAFATPKFLAATIRAEERLKKTIVRQHPSVRASYTSEPLVTLCELTGVAIFYSRLLGSDDLRKPFVEGWDSLFSTEGKRLAQYVLLSLDVNRNAFIGLTSPSLMRGRRQQIIEHDLVARGGQVDTFDIRLSHPDPWVSSVLAHGHFIDYAALFAVEYLLPTLQSKNWLDLEIPRHVVQLSESLSRRVNRDPNA